MKKIFKNLVTGSLVAGMTAMSMFTSAFADETDVKKVYLSVEKFTIGQGYVCEPVTVELNEGDKGLDVLKRAVGEENVIVTTSDWGSYISGFKDVDTGVVCLPNFFEGILSTDDFTGRNTEGQLSEFDYTSEAGFMFFVNGSSALEGIDSYTPQDGDVLTVSFTIYNYGADIGIDNSSWGGSASLIGNVNRAELTKAIALAKAEDVDVAEEIAVISNLDSTQADIDSAVESVNGKLAQDETPDDTETPIETPEVPSETPVETPSTDDKTPTTGVAVSLIAPTILGAVCVSLKKRK